MSSVLDEQRLFHGSPQRKAMPAFGTKRNREVAVSPGRPFFVTESEEYARFFARGGTVTEFNLRASNVLDLRLEANVDELLKIFNGDLDHRDSPWDESVEGDIYDSAYFLLESKAVWNHLVNLGVEAVLLAERTEPHTESVAVLDPSILTIVKTRLLSPPSEPLSSP